MYRLFDLSQIIDMQDELNFIEKNKHHELVPERKDRSNIGIKGIFKNKNR